MAYSRDKLAKHRVMVRSSRLASALPKTRAMTKDGFRSLIDRYGKVILKPSRGSGGVGVMAVTAAGGGYYRIHSGRSQKSVKGFAAAYSYAKGKTRGASYLVQRKIALARVNGRPFDARIMLQRRSGSDWALTGKLAKVAGSGYIITNIARSKGRVLTLSEAIRRSNIRGASTERIHRRIDRLSLQAVRQLNRHYRIRTVGLDIGIDTSGKPWIIEANFTPAKSLFLKLKDKSMYRRIMSYK